jgi:hypothetical protein
MAIPSEHSLSLESVDNKKIEQLHYVHKLMITSFVLCY